LSTWCGVAGLDDESTVGEFAGVAVTASPVPTSPLSCDATAALPGPPADAADACEVAASPF